MGSGNAVFILPGALRARGAQLARASLRLIHSRRGSVLHETGHCLCTAADSSGDFSNALDAAVAQSSPFVLLTPRIGAEFDASVLDRQHNAHLRVAARSLDSPSASGVLGHPVLFETSAESFLSNPDLAKEIFGPTTLLVRYGEARELLDAALALDGHLTVTVHAEEDDLINYPRAPLYFRKESRPTDL